MLTSAFAYYRGAAAPVAWDLGHMATPDLRLAASFAVAARDTGLKEGADCAPARRTSLKAMTRFCDQGANPQPRLTGPLLPAEGAQRRVEDP